MWVDKDGKPYQGGGVIIGNKRYWSPTDAQFIEAGYHWYIPPAPEPPDMTEFNSACAQFRAVCAQIEQAAELPGFKGGFDEMTAFQQSPIYSTLSGLQLAMAWSAANEFCKYEGEKVGFGQPQWWYECWQQVEPDPEPVPEPESEPEPPIMPESTESVDVDVEGAPQLSQDSETPEIEEVPVEPVFEDSNDGEEASAN